MPGSWKQFSPRGSWAWIWKTTAPPYLTPRSTINIDLSHQHQGNFRQPWLLHVHQIWSHLAQAGVWLCTVVWSVVNPPQGKDTGLLSSADLLGSMITLSKESHLQLCFDISIREECGICFWFMSEKITQKKFAFIIISWRSYCKWKSEYIKYWA